MKPTAEPQKFNPGSTLIKLDETNRSKRAKWSWTKTNSARADDVNEVCQELHRFWPITERQLYYRLISNNLIQQRHWHKHNQSDGKRVDVESALKKLLKWMRIDEKLPWDAIVDETRLLTEKAGSESPEEFIRSHMWHFLRGYSRCVAQDQPNHVEVWLEKNALIHIVEPVADEFCRRVMVCKGYNSVTFIADFYRRAKAAMESGQKVIVLYFGDWDPSGVNMLYATIQTLHDELGLRGVEYHRCGINPEHFDMVDADPVPLKDGDKRAKPFIKKYGHTCYELDALHPHDLEELVRQSLIRFTDMEARACNFEIQKRDLEFIAGVRDDVQDYIDNMVTPGGCL